MIGFLRNVFIKDLGLKLFALAWAVLIWATVQFAISRGITGVPQSGPTATIFERNKITTNRQSPPATPTPLPVQFTFSNLPVLKMSAARDVLALTVQPEHVDVTVQGEEHLIQQLTGRDIRVTVDVMGITAARGLRKRVEVITPPGITLVRVVPENVDIIVPTP